MLLKSRITWSDSRTMNPTYRVDLCLGSLDSEPFFSIESPHPFCVSVGDEIEGDFLERLGANEGITVSNEHRLVIRAVRHYLYGTDGSGIPGRKIRVAVALLPFLPKSQSGNT